MGASSEDGARVLVALRVAVIGLSRWSVAGCLDPLAWCAVRKADGRLRTCRP